MAKEADRPRTAPRGARELSLSAEASAGAPFLYFEEATAYGHMNGMIRLTLEAVRLIATAQGSPVLLDRAIVAHVRTNVAGAVSLRNALDAALLLARPTESEAKN